MVDQRSFIIKKTAKLIKILSEGEPKTKDFIRESLGLENRQVERYIKAIQEEGFNVLITKDEKDKRIKLFKIDT